MAYTTIDKSDDYFNTVLYTGTGLAGQAQTGVGFQPDLVWTKSRSNTYPHQWYDVIRGVTQRLQSNDTSAEATQSNGLTAFGTDGFTVGDASGTGVSGATYASWNWKANGTGVANTDGSISSTVSANTTSGFSIVSYTGTGSNLTIGHGLGAIPKMIIVKKLTASDDWYVYHNSTGAGNVLKLNTTAASSADALAWQNTTPTSSLVYLGARGEVNAGSTDYIAYCFAEKQGYSKFGSYVGNGNADGTFVYTGFKVAMIICKNTGAAEDWIIKDNTRDIDNPVDDVLYPNANYVEDDGATVDFLSNGFKCRTTAANTNQSGNTFIYMAFAENPFVTSTAIPACAR
jgi:hypothetical protein